jgi:outer membrane protein assembly factor BamB
MKSLLFIISVLLISLSSIAQNSLSFRGNDRNGIYNEANLLTEWPETGPELLWSIENIPPGYSSVSVFDGTVYTTGRENNYDYLVAVNPDGSLKYKVLVGKAWDKSFPESRCTPTINDNKLYTISGLGEVYCLNKENGEVIWSVNAYDKFEGKTGEWGYSESPLVFEDKVFVSIGGDKTTIVALNKNTGETIWESNSINDWSAYVSPILVKENGKNIIINVMATNVLGVDASNGSIIFNHNYANIQNEKSLEVWPGAPYTNTNNVLYQNKQIYVTSGYNHVGVKFQLSDDLSKIEVAYIDTILDIHFGGAVLVDGFIYGSNWINNGTGNWCCVNFETGKLVWEKKWKGKGAIIANDNLLYMYDDKIGNVGIAKVSTEELEIISSFKVPLGKGPHWSHPVISNGILYIRHMDALMAYSIKK